MFAFALWDEARQELFCARDRFGIKPFYHATNGQVFYFASEVKALLPFLGGIDTDLAGLADYLTFQFCLDGKTLFKDVQELQPGHTLTVGRGRPRAQRYWQVHYDLDFDHSEEHFRDRLRQLLEESVKLHRRSDAPIGGYLSGGLDSSILACLAAPHAGFEAFVGKFDAGDKFDESRYARAVATEHGFPLHEVDITEADFIANIRKVIYYLDYPVAGPGSFPQYMVSQVAARRRKVMLGGQGADEIFGGYVRYLIASLEQRLKAGIDGTTPDVTIGSLLPSLPALREYRPLLQEFWRDGIFDAPDARYFRLINRATTLGREIRWDALRGYSAYEAFQSVFRAGNVAGESYFDRITHFDFRTLLPALLHVEDRVGMAHGLESRVPFLDHPLVEFAATIPSAVKFKNARNTSCAAAAGGCRVVLERTDKMGFPVPLSEWLRGETGDFARYPFVPPGSRARRDRQPRRHGEHGQGASVRSQAWGCCRWRSGSRSSTTARISAGCGRRRIARDSPGYFCGSGDCA